MWEYCPGDVEEVLRVPTQDLDFAHFRLLLGGTFEQSLYYLPDALLYMGQDANGQEISSNVISFIGSYAGDLERIGLYDDALRELSAVFWTWISTFPVRRVFRQRPPYDLLIDACVGNQDDRDEYLDWVRDNTITAQGTDLFALLLHTWANDMRRWEWSAHLLDLFLQVRLPGILQVEMYSDERVVATITDRGVIDRHWAKCKQQVHAVCPREYVEALEGLLRSSGT